MKYAITIKTSLCCVLSSLAITSQCFAEDSKDSLDLSYGPVTFGAFVDTYAAHDFNDPEIRIRPYTTQPTHEDQVNLNLAFVEAKLDDVNWRGRLAVQDGTSVESNYAAEKYRFWRYIQESTLGYKLSDKLWIDGGIYFAHVGFETFNSRDNWNYTRSLVAEYSPYYETGVKLSYQFSDQTTGQLHVVRGWQNISNNADPLVGMQLSHALTEHTQLTYANYVGNIEGIGTRYFNDFIGKVDLTDSLSVALQVDVGAQEGLEAKDTAWWHGWSLMSRYKITEKIALGGRVERFFDPHQVVLATLNGEDFNATGLSANIDFEIFPKLLWRNEYRVFLGRNSVFPKDDEGEFDKNGSFFVTSLSYSL